MFPSPEIAQAVGSVKEYLDWMSYNKIQDFEESWRRCPNGVAMFKVLLVLNPSFKDLHWVALRAALRVAQAENMDLDERVLGHLAKKRLALTEGLEDYAGDDALVRATALNRIMIGDNAPKSKSSAIMVVGFACCKSARTCQLALEGAVHAERFRITERPDYDPDIDYPTTEALNQANDIREFFSLPLTMNKIRYKTRYQRPWVI